jgi:hypothetical protein
VTRFARSAVWLAACLTLVGCHGVDVTPVRIDSLSGMYQTVTLNYRVDTGQLSEPVTVACISDHQVRQRQLPSSPHPDCSIAQLTVRFPHPSGKPGVAQAQVTIETRQPRRPVQAKKASWEQWAGEVTQAARDLVPGLGSGDAVYEIWAMDIPRGELDLAIAGMTQSGYFIGPARPTLGVELAAKVDNFQARKRWARVPELDLLLDRVRQDGRLVSYQHPLESVEESAVAVNQASPFRTVAAQGNEIQGPALVPAGPQAYGPPSEPAGSYAPPPPLGPPVTGPPAYAPPASVAPAYAPPAVGGAAGRGYSPPNSPPANQSSGNRSFGAPNRSRSNMRAQPGVAPRVQLPPQYRRQVPAYNGRQAGGMPPPSVRSRYAPPAARPRPSSGGRLPTDDPRQQRMNGPAMRGPVMRGPVMRGQPASGQPTGEANAASGRRSFWPRFGRPRPPRGAQPTTSQPQPNQASYQPSGQ